MSDATAPLRITRFRALWIAAIFSNVGSFLQTVAGAWLMKELTNSSATWIGLMVASNLLPLLFLSLLAGVVADMFGKAKVMLVAQIIMGLAAAAMAVTAALDIITPGLLLGFGLMLGTGLALNLPAWQALVPELVPRGMVASAVALNSVAFNVARAVGPALGGIVVATAGPELGFALNAVSYLGVIIVVIMLIRTLNERVESASMSSIATSVGLSIRYARFTPAFRRLLGLVALFALTSAAIQSVLPNRVDELRGDETTYGLLLGAMGLGALISAVLRPRIPRLVAGTALPYTIAGFGIAGVGSGIAPTTLLTFVAMLVVGACWVWTLTTLNATSQLMSPSWIRGRAMSLYTLAFTGLLPIGSIFAGALADRIGAGATMASMSVATVALGIVTPRFHVPVLSTVETPAYDADRRALPHADTEGGPVMVINTWRIHRDDLTEFLDLMNEIRLVRLRTGAYSWELYRNASDPHRLSEVFRCVSWEEHLAQHRRTDDASLRLIRHARDFDRADGPVSRHLIAIDVADEGDWEPLMLAHDEFHRTEGSIPLIDVTDPLARE
jgi:MFS family permease